MNRVTTYPVPVDISAEKAFELLQHRNVYFIHPKGEPDWANAYEENDELVEIELFDNIISLNDYR